jgi:hypothetical protein
MTYRLIEENWGAHTSHPSHEIFSAMLIGLFLMHIYWTTLIFKIIWGFFIHGERHDIREKKH